MGLGSVADRTLSEARELAHRYRQLLHEGIDPIEHREAERQKNRMARTQKRTFELCARDYYDLYSGTWKNAKHTWQWLATMTAYVFPVFGAKDVSDVSKADILEALEPIWTTKTETASRTKQRIRAVLDWSAAKDYRHGHDPHLWVQVAKALPKIKDLKKSGHFVACPYPAVYDVLQSIRTSPSAPTVKLAMEFSVLNASRPGEVRLAKKSEIDFAGKRWIIPPERMKAGREHRVPLSDRSMGILQSAFELHGDSDLIFPNRRGAPFSDTAFVMVLRRLGHNFVMHGFRSTFRDWAAEQTAFPREVCEAALAHAGKDATEGAYFRSDLFEKRRQLMDAWATYCSTRTIAPSAT